MLKGLKYKLMLKLLDISEIKDSTHTIYLPTKMTKKWLEQLRDQTREGQKMYWKVGIELFINENNSSNIHLA